MKCRNCDQEITRIEREPFEVDGETYDHHWEHEGGSVFCPIAARIHYSFVEIPFASPPYNRDAVQP